MRLHRRLAARWRSVEVLGPLLGVWARKSTAPQAPDIHGWMEPQCVSKTPTLNELANGSRRLPLSLSAHIYSPCPRRLTLWLIRGGNGFG